MTAAFVIAALGLSADSQVGQRVPKKLIAEKGSATSADRSLINDGIEELLWVAALKPGTIGVPVFRDTTREYLEIAVLSLTLRPGARIHRLTELIHRAIPYPVFLIQEQSRKVLLSLAHLRWSQGQSGQTVLDGPLTTATVETEIPATEEFLASLQVTGQPRQNLHALYSGWMGKFDAYSVALLTGKFATTLDTATAERRRAALAEHERLAREITKLRARGDKETQLNRLVELNLELKKLESSLAKNATQL